MKSEQQIKLSEIVQSKLEQKIISLPLQFEYIPVEVISKQFTKLNSNHSYRIHYLGPRFTNTLILHKKYSSVQQKDKNYFQRLLDYQKYDIQLRKIVQSHYLNEKLQNNHYYKSAIFYRAFQGMNPTLNVKDQFIFNSCFEGGNLDCVIKVNKMEFDLFLRIDSNTRGHTQWFYFSVQNGNKLGKVTFNICNLTKAKTLYQQGMRPYVFSKNKFQKNKTEWEQDGQNVSLTEKPFRYSLIYEYTNNPRVYRLSFDYNFTEENDQVYFAYSIPYTFSQMLGDVQKMPTQFVKRQILGRSLTGIDIPILHITNHELETKKKNILITGRIHPGESNSSLVLKGFMQYLCGDSKDAIQLRNRVNFFIIPIINPDGVIMGNSRTSASGKDLNRQYYSQRRQLYPQVVLVKRLALRLQKLYGVMMYFDFHGHSRKKNTFLYGPGYTLSDNEYYKSKALAKLIEKINNSFRFYSCSFMISDDKKRTARAVLFDQIKIPYTFTIQSSIGLFYDANKLKTIEFTIEEWINMGVTICKGLSQFLVAYEDYEEILRERRLERKRNRQRRQRMLNKKISKKFNEDDFQRDQSNIDGQNGKKSMLMFDLMQEIKQLPPPPKNIEEASSDDHDDAEDLQVSKLAEFNNLIIQSKQKDQSVMKMKPIEEEEYQPKPKKVETETDQYQIMKEVIEEKQKKKTPKVFISKVAEKPNIKVCSNKLLKKNHTNPTPNIAKSTRLSLSKYKQETEALVPAKNTPDSIKHRKSFNLQTHRHLVSKQFFPYDRCEIVEFPKSSGNARKEVKKGRVFLDEYLQDKKKGKEEREEKKAMTEEKRLKKKSESGSKFKVEELRMPGNKKYGIRHEKNLSDHRTTNRIFDTLLFSGFQGMQIDNMAMMIRTFNK